MKYNWEIAFHRLKDIEWKYFNKKEYRDKEQMRERVLLLQSRYNAGERSSYLYHEIMNLKEL